MKKKNIVLIVILFILVVFYFGCKGFYLYYYNIGNSFENYEEYIEGLNIKDTILVQHQTVEDYLEFNGIKVKNEFTNFEPFETSQNIEDVVKYVLRDEKGSVLASFWMGTTYTYVDILKNDSTLFGTSDKRISNTSFTNFLEKNNIHNDIQLFQYLINHKFKKNHIFTSVKNMREEYSLQFIVSIMLPTIDHITLIDGDYQGYIFNMTNKVKEVSILKNDKRYILTFINTDYFTDELIEEILNTMVID